MAQNRHENRFLYFQELAKTSREYFIPYISKFKEIQQNMNILEIGCGDGGNLLPFAQMGCNTIGIDIAECRIKDAISFFQKEKAKGKFILSDILKTKDFENKYDIIICHDVFEHIEEKKLFLNILKNMLIRGGGDFHVIPCMANAIWRTPTDL